MSSRAMQIHPLRVQINRIEEQILEVGDTFRRACLTEAIREANSFSPCLRQFGRIVLGATDFPKSQNLPKISHENIEYAQLIGRAISDDWFLLEAATRITNIDTSGQEIYKVAKKMVQLNNLFIVLTHALDTKYPVDEKILQRALADLSTNELAIVGIHNLEFISKNSPFESVREHASWRVFHLTDYNRDNRVKSLIN